MDVSFEMFDTFPFKEILTDSNPKSTRIQTNSS